MMIGFMITNIVKENRMIDFKEQLKNLEIGDKVWVCWVGPGDESCSSDGILQQIGEEFIIVNNIEIKDYELLEIENRNER